MNYTISIDRAGRLMLPKPIRDQFNLRGGDRIELETVGDHLELRPVAPSKEVELIEKFGRLVIPATGGEPFDAAEAIRADREERDERLAP